MLCLLTLSLLLLNLYFRLHQTRKISGPLAAKRKSIWIVLSIGSLTYHVLIRWPFWGGHNQLIFDLEICWQWQPIRRGRAYCSKVSIDLWDFFSKLAFINLPNDEWWSMISWIDKNLRAGSGTVAAARWDIVLSVNALRTVRVLWEEFEWFLKPAQILGITCPLRHVAR